MIVIGLIYSQWPDDNDKVSTQNLVVLDFGHHVVFLIKALPVLALFVFVNADVYTNRAVS